jgi:predicted alpha/beta hydrolase
MQDDDWITETGMKLLMNETYVNMKPIYRTVHPNESNGEEIGHINFFRAKHSKLWSIVFDWFS